MMRIFLFLLLILTTHCLFPDTKFCDPLFKKIFTTDEAELFEDFDNNVKTKIDKIRTVHYVC